MRGASRRTPRNHGAEVGCEIVSKVTKRHFVIRFADDSFVRVIDMADPWSITLNVFEHDDIEIFGIPFTLADVLLA